jgi:uncharacterized protein (DUF433 family)
MAKTAKLRRRMTHEHIDIPLYHLATAARWVGVPASTLRAWMYGRHYVAWGRRMHSPVVIEPADPTRGLVSFANITEAHLLEATRGHHIALKDIRYVIDQLRAEDPSDRHPLLRGKLMHRGKSLFVETMRGIISASRPHEGQGFLDHFETNFSRIEIKNDGHIRLFPVRRNTNKTVVLNSDVAGGQPIIANTGILVEHVQDLRQAGMSVKKIARQYGLDEATIGQAIGYIKRAS